MEQTGLSWIDWTVIVVYASATIALGWFYSRKQKDSREYFIGSGSLNPVLVGVSLFATHLSTISYLSVPGETISKGPIMILLIIPCYPVSYFIVRRYLLSVYMRHRVTSAYELLEQRLGLGVRLLGAGMFIVVRLSWMCLLVYVAARAMTVMLGVSEEWIPWIVLVTGFVSIIYTSLGGLGAVVITDFLQTALLLGGAIVVIILVTVELGDFSWIPTSWQATWDSQPAFSFDPRVRVTMFGTFMSVLVWTVCTAGGDQLSIQRFMSTGDAKAAKRAYLAQALVASTVLFTLLFVGFALMGYFQARPDELPPGLNLATDGDQVFPRFIAFHLPVGIAGLVVSAMFAAAMSSLDSGVNSITAVVTTDFLERFGLMPKTRKGYVRLASVPGLRPGGRRGHRKLLHGERPRQHHRDDATDHQPAGDARLQPVLLRPLLPFRQTGRSGGGSRLRDHGGRADRLLREFLHPAARLGFPGFERRHRRLAHQLSVDQSDLAAGQPGRRRRPQQGHPARRFQGTDLLQGGHRPATYFPHRRPYPGMALDRRGLSGSILPVVWRRPRAADVRGPQCGEIDTDERVWTIPPRG